MSNGRKVITIRESEHILVCKKCKALLTKGEVVARGTGATRGRMKLGFPKYYCMNCARKLNVI